MTKITIKEPVVHEVEFDVEFPVYRKIVCGDYTSFGRWTEDGTVWTVSVDEDECRIEREEQYMETEREQLLGLGKYACTPAEWVAALAQAKAFLASVPE
jgi:hypothetical protein